MVPAATTNTRFLALLVFAGLQPMFGSLSDRIGRRPLLIWLGPLGTVGTVPLRTALSLSHTTTPWVAFGLLAVALVIVSGYSSSAVVKAELFPVEIRALGIGLPQALTVAVFGGTAEYLVLWSKQAWHAEYYYVAACIGVSLLVFVRLPETRLALYLDTDAQA